MSQAPIPSKSSKSPPDDDDDEKPRRRRRFEDDDDRDDLNVRRTGDIPTYLTQSILVTLCCCWPLGIVAIIMAARVNSALGRGDYEAALQSSEDAKKWCWIAFVLGLIVNAIAFGINIMADNNRF